MNNYQHDYASGRPQMYEKESRKIKAIRIVKLLEHYYGKGEIDKLTVLDVGASTGIIDNELAKYFKKVIGIDIDKDAIKYANKKFKQRGLYFKVDDAMNLSFEDNFFDIVICAQVYEHVPDDRKLMNEIYRVLKPSGVCYFAALNKFWPLEPHYNLLFLSWLPKNIGDYYVRVLGKAKRYYETLRSYWGLNTLTNKFERIEFTSKILRSPKNYGFNNLSTFPINMIVWLISPLSRYLAPTFFWLLIKKS